QAEDGIRDFHVTGVQTCALPILTERFVPSARYQPFLLRFGVPQLYRELARALGVRSRPGSSRLCSRHNSPASVLPPLPTNAATRSEERRVGKECRSQLADSTL